ncbi:MAG: elongation factor G, partial [Thermoleophilia bacterium]|nr:elongation factor G [Thermoleophilia bacterium]
RGHPLGMEPKASVTEIRAEVPMAEVLDYAPDLRAMTSGRGEYSLEFARYEEVPAQLVSKVVDAAAGAESAA